ncbi:transposase [Alteromonas gracilis]|uniref:transposase n=1 Tax=Alteromonas gracilis TaxID=1479524 RepID=UPI0037370899
MPLPRYKQINTEVTPYYHCISRCVRQSYLCGKDTRTGINYEHRRKWIQDRLHRLTQAFAIDLCAYAVMHNHIHIVLHIAKGRADSWTMDEVLLRWRMFYKCPPVVQRYLDDFDSVTLEELTELQSLSVIYRERLQSISWFMRLLNEYIARKANKEDECTGYFWERRFKSQAILDEKALASVMAYVDLNPIRAKIATTLNNSHYTSIQYRLNAKRSNKVPRFLMPFYDGKHENKVSLPFDFSDYLQLITETLTAEKSQSSRIGAKLPSRLLTKLGMTKENWQLVTSNFETLFTGPVGCPEMMNNFAKCCHRSCRPNVTNAQKYLS